MENIIMTCPIPDAKILDEILFPQGASTHLSQHLISTRFACTPQLLDINHQLHD